MLLGASLLGNVLADEGTIRAEEGAQQWVEDEV